MSWQHTPPLCEKCLSPSPHCSLSLEIQRGEKKSFWQQFSAEVSWGSITHGTRSAGFGGAAPVSTIALALLSPGLLSQEADSSSLSAAKILPRHAQSFSDKQPLKQHRTSVLCLSAAISQDRGLRGAFLGGAGMNSVGVGAQAFGFPVWE